MSAQPVIAWAAQPGPQMRLLQCKIEDVFYGGARGGMKAQPLDTLIPTPSGWTTIGEIAPGDFVLGEDGRPVKVIALSEIRDDEDAYRFSFSDGTSVVSSEGHIWKTQAKSDRCASRRRTEEFCSQRKAKRPSRATGNGKRPHVAACNAAREYEYLAAPGASLRCTKEIHDTLMSGLEVNHSIQNPAPIELSEAILPIPPYTLGAWLGDGTSLTGAITGVDEEIFAQIEADGFSVTGQPRSPITHNVLTLSTKLRSAGLKSNKHIPPAYLRASYAQRLALLQGLMDTDGTSAVDGSCLITLTRKELFDGVVELIRTFGIIVNVRSSYATATNGKPGNSTLCWTACFVSSIPVFRLTRKLARQNKSPHARYSRRFIVASENIGPVPMRCIKLETEDGMYLTGEQMIPTHNTVGLILDWLRHKTEYGSHCRGILFRRTYPELHDIIATSKEIYPLTGAKYNENDHVWTWPDGATLLMRFIANDDDADLYKGFNFTWMGFDELTHWPSPVPIDKLWASLRSTHGIPCVRRSTGNPGGPGHAWVKARYRLGKDEVKPYQAFKNTPNPERTDLWYESVFIPSRLSDNKILLEKDPRYASRLAAATAGDPALFKSWLEGDWDMLSGAYFDCFDPAIHVVKNIAAEKWFPRWMGIDWGFSHSAAAYWGMTDESTGTVWIYREHVTKGKTPKELASELVDRSLIHAASHHSEAEYENLEDIYLGPDAWAQKTTERTIQMEMTDVFREHGLPEPTKAVDARVSGWQLMYQLLSENKLFIHASCKNLIALLPTLVRNPKKPEDILKVDGDDPGDGARYLLMTRLAPARVPEGEQIRRILKGQKPAVELTDKVHQWNAAKARVLTARTWGTPYGRTRCA